ncbi:MAG TPA: hypothetical protein DCM40_38035, partial [Maribacter sp.]|nr:hypothetical protein [Maribacter sp.]
MAFLKNNLDEVHKKLSSSPQEFLDIKLIATELKKVEKEIDTIKAKNATIAGNISENEEVLLKIEEGLSEIDVSDYEDKLGHIDEKLKALSSLEKEIELIEQRHSVSANKVKLLAEVPCGSEYSHCKFIKDAYKAESTLKEAKIELEDLAISKRDAEKEINQLEPDVVKSYLKTYDDLVKKRRALTNDVSDSKLVLEKNRSELLVLMRNHNDLQDKKKQYEDNEQAI